MEKYKEISIWCDGESYTAYQFNGHLYDRVECGNGRYRMVKHSPKTGMYRATGEIVELVSPFHWAYGPEDLHTQTIGEYKGMAVEVIYAGHGMSDVNVQSEKGTTTVGQVETVMHNPDHASNTDLLTAEELVRKFAG